MTDTVIQATCCEVSTRPGVAHVTNLPGHLPGILKCGQCGKEYRVDYNPYDATRIADFKNRLRAEAQRAVDASHPMHPVTGYIQISRIPGPPIP